MIKLLSFLVNIVDIPMRIFNTWTEEPWNIWSWGLDSYRISKLEPNQKVAISIERADKRYSIEQLELFSLVQQEEIGFYEQRVYRNSYGDIFWAFISKAQKEIMLLYRTNSDFSQIVLLEDNTNSSGTVAFSQLIWMMPAVFLNHEILTFHGVLMEHEGKGIIISAPSGTGKSTHARLWRDLKHTLIINGDKVACKEKDGIWRSYGIPWSGTSGEQINRSVPMKAFVVLERGKENTVRRLTPLEAFSAMLPNLYCPTWDGELVGRAMEQLDSLLKTVPVYRLRCRPDEEAVEVLYQALQEE